MAGGGTQGWTGGWNETLVSVGTEGRGRCFIGLSLVPATKSYTHTQHTTHLQIFLLFPVAHCLLEVKPVVDISSHFILFIVNR